MKSLARLKPPPTSTHEPTGNKALTIGALTLAVHDVATPPEPNMPTLARWFTTTLFIVLNPPPTNKFVPAVARQNGPGLPPGVGFQVGSIVPEPAGSIFARLVLACPPILVNTPL